MVVGKAVGTQISCWNKTDSHTNVNIHLNILHVFGFFCFQRLMSELVW